MLGPPVQFTSSREPWCFYAHLHRPAKAEESEQGNGPAALQLPEVLAQVRLCSWLAARRSLTQAGVGCRD
jgi:hypothetical protein